MKLIKKKKSMLEIRVRKSLIWRGLSLRGGIIDIQLYTLLLSMHACQIYDDPT